MIVDFVPERTALPEMHCREIFDKQALLKMQTLIRHTNQGIVQLTLVQHLLHLIVCAINQRQYDIRIDRCQGVHQPGDKLKARSDGNAQSESPFALHFLKLLLQSVPMGQDMLALSAETLTGSRRRCLTEAVSLKKTDTQFFFHFLKTLAQGRLRNIQLLSGFCKAPAFRDFQNIAHIVNSQSNPASLKFLCIQ